MNDLERDVIDTPEFQRLFRTSQMGFVDLVFQTANHTRGAHSIGACHIANRLIDHLNKNTNELYDEKKKDRRDLYAYFDISPAERILIRLGALLHDISHLPFSHDIEKKTHRIPYGLTEGGDLKLRSWYGHYDKHDDYDTNPLLYLLVCDHRKSVLANVLRRYSEPFFEQLSIDVTETERKHGHIRDFFDALKQKVHPEWKPVEDLLPQLLFHLLIYEKPDEAKYAARQIVTGFDKKDSETESWHFGPPSLTEDAPGAAFSAGTTLSVDDEKWGTLKPSLRFSIAHEIAHAVFLKAAGDKSHRDFFQKNQQAFENGCNILARIFLLPKSMLIREIDSRLFDVDHLSRLVLTLHVSPEVFLRRFHVSDLKGRFTDVDGLLAFVQDKEENVEFKACHMWGDNAIGLFQHSLKESKRKTMESEHLSLSTDYSQPKWILQGLKLNEIGLGNSRDIEYRLRNNQADKIEMDVKWARGEVIPCRLSFRLLGERPPGWLFCVQVMGPIQKPGQGYLF